MRQVCAAARAAVIARIAATAVALRAIATTCDGRVKEETKKEGAERRKGKVGICLVVGRGHCAASQLTVLRQAMNERLTVNKQGTGRKGLE